MKLSTRARYGARLMVQLGLHYGEGSVFLREIARQEEISEKYLSQIIIPLKASGLVTSFRGAHGGYVLARHPSKITMKDIVGVLEGDFNLAGCVKNISECNRISICATRHVWKELGEAIAEKLESVTLQDLVRGCKQKQQQAVMYNI